MRRHKLGKYPYYDQCFGKFRGKSDVLNMDIGMNFISVETSNKIGCEGVLDNVSLKLKRLTKETQAEHAKFEKFQDQKISQGFDKPEKMPPAMFKRLLFAEAKEDCCKLEIESLKRKLEKVSKPEKDQKDKLLLKFGPVGSAKGQPLKIIDGQPVSYNKKGIPFIDCPRSPYHRMLLCHYRKYLVVPFLKISSRKAIKWESLPERPKIKVHDA